MLATPHISHAARSERGKRFIIIFFEEKAFFQSDTPHSACVCVSLPLLHRAWLICFIFLLVLLIAKKELEINKEEKPTSQSQYTNRQTDRHTHTHTTYTSKQQTNEQANERMVQVCTINKY